jgi:hypothetical protein
MLKNRAGYSFVFFLTFVLFFACAAGADAQSAKSKKTAKKPSAAKKGQAPPTLKPAATGKAKEKAASSSAASNTAAKTDTAKEHSAPIPEAAPEKETKAAEPHAAAVQAGSVKSEPKQNPATANPKAEIKAAAKTDAKAEVKEKTAPAKTSASAKTGAKGKPVVAAPRSAKTNGAKKTEPKTDTAAVDKKPNEKPAPAIAGKKPGKKSAKEAGPKKKIAVAAVRAEKNPEKKLETKPEPKAAPVKAKPEETVMAAAPSKNWLPPISADKLRADLNGKTVTDIPSEEPGDGRVDWLFAGNQPKDVEIVKVDRSEDVRIVEARLSAKKTHPNLDGSFERVRGTARFHYERGGKGWELLYIENVSLRHSDTNPALPVQNPVQKPPQKPVDTLPATDTAASVISAPPVNIIPGASLNIGAGKYQSYSFQVRDTAVVTGKFRAQGGPQNDIEAYILDQDGFANWANDHSAPAYYNSGRLTVGSIDTVLGAGTYYLVFNNRYSPGDRKTVEASIQLRTDPASLASMPSYNGAGAGTITTVRRTYAPGANPVQPYTRPAETAAVPTKPISPAPRVSEVAAYRDEVILSDRFDIGGGQQYAIPFSVKNGGAVRGTFNVAGGEISAYIMTAAQYDKWTATREGVLDYSSGRVSGGSINRSLNAGDYYLVFSNRYSLREPKTVRAEIQVEYLPR